VPDLILDLGNEGEFALERRCIRDPFPFRQCPADLAVGVHVDQADELLAILGRHPVGRLDFLAALNPRFELCKPLIELRLTQSTGVKLDVGNHHLAP